ncbi:MAG TPA: glycosyltransferase family 4 protein [Thermoleophilaceae bacterium]|nr:glycosyltransferase family 4 protein [Thermoleophilaceae bacterium]
MAAPRVLVLHNRYRIEGGEERSVALQLEALENAGVEHRALQRSSADAGKVRAAAALLGGGDRPEEIAAAVREMRATVLHAHNTLPLIGPRGLTAAREAGARVVLHLHNVRLFCAIGVASRDGGPCFRCHGRLTLPGLVLNCRGSLPEAAVYAAALSLYQPSMVEAVDRFVAPSRYAAGQLALLGLPRERIEVLPHYLPASAFADGSAADRGGYALATGRLSQEKGFDVAIEAAGRAGVPLRIAGEGPAAAELAALGRRLDAPVELVGRLARPQLDGLVRGAAMLVMPSRYHEFSPYSALEAMAAGLPVIATQMGGLPELIGPERCLPINDPAALAARMRELWEAPERRRADGEELLARARASHSQAPFTSHLLDLYERVGSGA